MEEICKYCRPNETFENITSLNAHIVKVHPNRCTVCFIHFGSFYTVLKHYDIEHKNCCPVVNCQATVGGDQPSRNQHLLQVHQKYPCRICLAFAGTEADLKYHYTNPVGEHPFRCNMCEGELFNNNNLWMHIYEVHKHICPFCDVQIKDNINNKMQWEEHLKKSHQLFPCSLCYEVFLDDVEKQHHFNDIHRFMCGNCTLSFPKKEARDKHVNEAHKVKCSVCTQYFNNDKLLQYHYETEHKFPCLICDMVFNSATDRDRHANVVHLVRCEVCGIHLDSHKMKQEHYNALHQISCELCSKMCTTVQELQLHCVNMHGKTYELALEEEIIDIMDEVHVCSECSEEFPDEEELVEHYKERHIHL